MQTSMPYNRQHSKHATLGLYAGSTLIGALYPIWATVFGFTEAVWLSTGLGLALNGIALIAFAYWWSPELFRDKALWQAVRLSLTRRKRALLPIAGVIVEDVSILLALLLIDPTVAQSILRFYPVLFAFLLSRSASDRFSFSREARFGLWIACLGAALVVLSAAEADFGGGWRLVAGIGLVAVAVAAISTKTQELALLADVGQRLGWSAESLKREQALSILLWGVRNLTAGMPVFIIALATADTMPPSFWAGHIVFGAILAPAAIISGRCALLLNSDLGLSSIRSAGVLVTLGFAHLVGGVTVANSWLLFSGSVCISLGTFITVAKYKPTMLSKLYRHR